MASIVYPMLLFIFIVGAGMAFFNASGMYEARMPTSGVQSTLEQANETNRALSEGAKSSSFNYIEALAMLGTTVIGGVIAVLTLGPLLASLGVPVGLAGFLISPLGIVVAFWIIEMWLGRPSE